MRAVAVIGVIGYHNFGWLPGGYYGVDAFFVLSGFLITSLLLAEWQGSGTIMLGRFWARRARRLLPAVLVLVMAVGLVATVWPAVFGSADLFPGAVATIFYSANWYFISGHASYFAAIAQPSPFLHTWSLAIEEQFYLVWPVIVLAVLKVGRSRAVRRGRASARERRLVALLVLASAGATASVLLMATLATAGGATTRAYYGTDTRSQGLLVGAALAVAFARWRLVPEAPLPNRSARWLMAGLATAGVVGSGLLWTLVPETSALAFHGGFLLAAIAAAAVVAGVVRAPAGPVAAALAWWPVRALGKISYGVYLWYWPVLLVMSGQRMHALGWLLFGERTTVTVTIAALSYWLIELPVRHRLRLSWRSLVAAPVAATLVLVAVGASTFVPAAEATVPRAATTARTSGTSLTGRALAGGATGGARGMGAANAAAVAGIAHPTKVLLVGDSIAGSLGVGLDQVAARYGVGLVNEGSPGCSVTMDQEFKVLGYTVQPGLPCGTGAPADLLDQWREWVDAYNPDVVVYLARGELFDQEVEGRWSNVGQRSFDHYLAKRFGQAISVLGSRGAAVELLTTPYYDSGEQPDGAPWPEDAPTRVNADNSIIRQAVEAAGSPGVGVFDFGSLVSPGGHFDQDVDGVDLRCTDGVHFTEAAGEWLAPQLLPELVRLGRGHHATSPGGTWPGPSLPTVPGWWSELPCGP